MLSTYQEVQEAAKNTVAVVQDSMRSLVERLRSGGNIPWDDIVQFYNEFYRDTPTRNHLPQTVLRSRLNHLHEELEEYAQAIQTGNVQKQLDALLDLIWVSMMTIALMKLPFPEAWRRVVGANMAKCRVPAQMTGRTTIVTTDGREWDLWKPEGWVAPEFGDLLENPAEQIMNRTPTITERNSK